MKYNFPLFPEVKVSDVFFKTLAGFAGGLFGSLMILIGVALAGSISFFDVTNPGDQFSPLYVFLALIISYIAILISSLSSLVLFYYTNRERYKYLLSTLTHVFLQVTLIFVVSIPLSLLFMFISANTMSFAVVALILLILTTLFSFTTQETIAGSKHLLLLMYAEAIALFSVVISLGVIYMFLSQLSQSNTLSFLALVVMPITWASFGFWQMVSEMTYQFFYQLYGYDFLNAQTRVESDYLKEQREKAEEK